MKRLLQISFCLIIFLSFVSVRAQKFTLQKTLNPGGGKIELLIYTPDRRHIVSGDWQGNVCFINPLTFEIDFKLKAHYGRVNAISFNRSGDLMLTATNDGEIKLWETSSFTLIDSYRHPYHSRITFCLFNPEESYIYFDLSEVVVKMKANFKEKPQGLFWHTHFSTCGIITPDNKYLAYGNGQSIFLVDLKTDKRFKELSYCSDAVNELSFKNKDEFVTWCQNGTINYWNKAKQNMIFVEPLKSFQAGDWGNYSKLDFSNDKNMIVAGGYKTTARVWGNANKLLYELKGHSDTVKTALFGLSDTVIFTGSYDRTIKVWVKHSPIPTVNEPDKIKKDSIKNDAVVIKKEAEKNEPVKPIEPHRVPPKFNNRNVILNKNYEVSLSEIDVSIWDDETEDGDVISIYLNGELIVDHYKATKEFKHVTMKFREHENNYLMIQAETLGKIPPNTVAVSFFDGKQKQRITLETDLKNSSALNFVYKP